MEHQINRASIFAKVAHSHIVDVDFETFRRLCFRGGIPDTPGIRPVCYKILLGYISFDDQRIRACQLAEKRGLYYEYLHDFLGQASSHSNVDVEENKAFEQIDKDVRRTLSELGFFSKKASTVTSVSRLHPDHEKSLYHDSRMLFSILKEVQTDFGSRSHSNVPTEEELSNRHTLGVDYHWEVIERVLFIYSKLNPGVGYVQGMNEVLAPLYYTFANDSNVVDRAHAEADSFWVFFAIMSEVKDMFMKSMDNDRTSGINASMTKLYSILKTRDRELWDDLQAKNLQPAFFAFRWLSLLLAQEFDLPDVLRLWDSTFSDGFRFNFLINICCAMLIIIREELLTGNFNDNVKLLQQYPAGRISDILRVAYRLYDEDVVDNAQAPSLSPQSIQTGVQSPIEELVGLFSPALQSISTAITGFHKKGKSER
eukprot:Partr_v1_DN27683_c2_g1_i4_m64689 putative TBC1 domain family member